MGGKRDTELNGLLVMVTGGAGFIGSHLVDRLIEMGNRVIVFDSLDEYYGGKESNISRRYRNSVFKMVNADILDYHSLSRNMRKVDIIFHLAGQPSAKFSFEHAHKANNVNTAGTLNVLEAAGEQRVKKTIFASSSSVYGAPEYLPIDEKHPTNPVSIYGASKLAAEKYCRIYNDQLSTPTVILRYFTVYGPRQRPDMAIYAWTKRLFENKTPVIYGDGLQTRDFTFIDDVIDGTLKAAEADDIKGEIFNLGGGTRTSVNYALKMLLKLMGKEEIEPVYEPPRLGDVPHTFADVSKAKKLLGYDPRTSLEEGIKKFLEWFSSATSSQKVGSKT